MLSAIDSPASQSRQTHLTLDAAHTGYSPSVTTEDLPPEILCYIFMLAKVHCTLDASSDRRVARFRTGDESLSLPAFSPDNISPVCVRWRKLFNSTPALWTHIDLEIDQFPDTKLAFHAERSLERAKQLPLYIHIEGNRSYSDSHALVALLTPYANRIVSLDLSGDALMSRSILLDLFSTPYHGSVRHLYLHDEDYEGPQEYEGGLLPSGPLDEFLLSLSSLSLGGPTLVHSSPAFQGLTDLSVIFSDMRPTPYRLTQILAASPALRSLTLLNLSLEPGNLPADAANLPNLQALDLRCTAFCDVLTITSCILPRRGLSMSITLNMYDDDIQIQDLSPLSSFFKRFHVARLLLYNTYLSGGIGLATALHSLETPLPSLEELALDRELLDDNDLNSCLSAERFPRLHTLHVIGKSVPVDELKAMLASSSIQAVGFRWKERHPSEVLQAISEVVPSIFYSLYDTLMDDQPFPWDLPSISYCKDSAL